MSDVQGSKFLSSAEYASLEDGTPEISFGPILVTQDRRGWLVIAGGLISVFDTFGRALSHAFGLFGASSSGDTGR